MTDLSISNYGRDDYLPKDHKGSTTPLSTTQTSEPVKIVADKPAPKTGENVDISETIGFVRSGKSDGSTPSSLVDTDKSIEDGSSKLAARVKKYLHNMYNNYSTYINILDNIKQAGVKTTSEQTEPDLPKPETQAQDEAKFLEDINKETQEALKKFEEENKPTLSSKLEADSNGLQ